MRYAGIGPASWFESSRAQHEKLALWYERSNAQVARWDKWSSNSLWLAHEHANREWEELARSMDWTWLRLQLVNLAGDDAATINWAIVRHTAESMTARPEVREAAKEAPAVLETGPVGEAIRRGEWARAAWKLAGLFYLSSTTSFVATRDGATTALMYFATCLSAATSIIMLYVMFHPERD